MEASRSQFALKLLPSLTDIAFLMPIAFLFGRMDGLATLLSDCDTGWHIRTGEWIVAHAAVPVRDLFSYSRPDAPWFAWEWLSDVIFAVLNARGGLAAVALFSILLVGLTSVVLFRVLRRRASALVAVLVTMLAAAASSVHWLARPHLFTLLFTVIFYAVLERARGGNSRRAGIGWLIGLPAVTILWTNLHGGFAVGIGMAAAFGLAELLNRLLAARPSDASDSLTAARRYFLCAASCLAASLVNPYGWRLHEHLLAYFRDPYAAGHIVEFFSLSFHHPMAVFFEIMLLAGAVAAVGSLGRRRFAEPLLFVAWGHLALLSVRHIPIFMILAAPLVAEAADRGLARLAAADLAGWLRRLAARLARLSASAGETDRIARLHLASALAVLILGLLLYAPHPPRKFKAEFDPGRYPAGAVARLAGEAGARIFTFDQWGDYLIYRLYPSTKVFVDGRSDFYGNDFERQFLDIVSLHTGWEQTLARFAVDTVLMPPDSPLTEALKVSSRWRVAYDDGIALIFRLRPSGPGEAVSAAAGGGMSRDREVTKTQASDRSITEWKSKT